jgi:endogenous inhibitor of DNA gyrase (YacG/DUF329 family)
VTSDRFTEQGWKNRQARNRARQRARHRTGMHFYDEYLRAAEKARKAGQIPTSAKATGYRYVSERHPRTYQRYYQEELAKETLIDLPMGKRPIYPCGTERAWRRHKLHGQDPMECEVCRAWVESEFQRTCKTCERSFVSRQPRTFCDDRCKTIWTSCLGYWTNFSYHAACQARSNLRHSTDPIIRRRAREQLAEYKRTGTITRRYKVGGAHADSIVRQLTAEIGLDLDERIAQVSGGLVAS